MNIISLLDKLDKRYRLYISLLLTVIVFLLVRSRHAQAVTFMLTWISFATASLIFSWITILSIHPKDIRVVASAQDSSRLVIFLLVVGAAFISLFAIIILLQNVPAGSKHGLSYHIVLSASSVASSWVLIHTLFTLRYAHLYYRYQTTDDGKDIYEGGLLFPDEDQPDFLDFAYFSFVIGMTFQVSDVQITARKIRRMVLLHGGLSFIYNTVIVALSINIISGIIGK